MAGMMATSAAPVRRASAHCDGTVKERSHLPCSGPWVKPRTSGAVLRYCTTEMRSVLTEINGCVRTAESIPQRLKPVLQETNCFVGPEGPTPGYHSTVCKSGL